MQHVNHLLSEYHDNALRSGQRQQVEAHLRDCLACRAELAQLEGLSNVLSAFTVPDASAGADTFRAQVMLRLTRQERKRPPHRSWFWYAVPLSLGSALILVEALIGALVLLAAVLSWGSVEIATSLTPLAWPEVQWLFGDWLVSAWLGLLNVLTQLSLYFILFLLFIPYAGWVGLLWRSAQKSRADVARQPGN